MKVDGRNGLVSNFFSEDIKHIYSLSIMTSLDDLKAALIETLDRRGALGQVKAKVRAEIFAALDDESAGRPELPRENLIINELIRQYLEHNQYYHTLSVFLPETGQPDQPPFDRQFLSQELLLHEDSRTRSLPILYGLVAGLRSELPVEPEPGIEVPYSAAEGGSLGGGEAFASVTPLRRESRGPRGGGGSTSMSVAVSNPLETGGLVAPRPITISG